MQQLQFKRISEVFKANVNVNHCRGGCRLGSCHRSLLHYRLLLLIRQLHPLPPLPAAPPHPPATYKGWCLYDGLRKPSLHMCTSGSCPQRPTREHSYAVAHTCCGGAPGPMCEIHTVRGKCGIAESATPPAAAAALHLRVQYVPYPTCCVFVRTVRRRPQVRTYCATLAEIEYGPRPDPKCQK
eukprot:363577-Chlamydomonas_euryale.AAC.7